MRTTARTAVRMTGALAFVAISQTAVWAQLAAPNEAGVAMGHVHLNSRDAQAEKKFWLTLGGVPANQLSASANREVIKFPGVLVAIVKRDQPPTAGSAGSVVDHIGFHVVNVQASTAKWAGAGIAIQAGGNGRKDQAFLTSPDGVKVEILEDPAQTVPITMHHIHFLVPEAVIPEIQAYYVKYYGAKAGKRGMIDTANLPGVELAFSNTATAAAPTKGRALDHIGFEVTNLQAFAKKQAAAGMTFVREYRVQDSFGIVVLTDPWGAAMELTEGQRQY